MCSGTSEAVGTIWEHAQLEFQKFLKIRIPLLICSLEGTQTLNTPINSTQIPFEKLLRHPPYISRHHRTLNDAVRHQQTPANVIQCQPEQQHILKLSFGVLGTVSWCLLVSVVVLNYPEIPGGADCEHMGEVYVCLWGLDVC